MLQKLLSSKLQAAGLAVWLACALVIAFGARGGSGPPTSPSREEFSQNLRVPIPGPALPVRLQ